MQSYGRMVDLLLAERRKRLGESLSETSEPPAEESGETPPEAPSPPPDGTDLYI